MSWLPYVPYVPMLSNINLEISSAVYQCGCIALCTFEESIDILSLVTPFSGVVRGVPELTSDYVLEE